MTTSESQHQVPSADAVLEILGAAHTAGATCAVLTPAMLREIMSLF